MKFCKDCEWARFDRNGDEPKCASTEYDAPRDMVFGNYVHEYCLTSREDEELCGVEARWFNLKVE